MMRRLVLAAAVSAAAMALGVAGASASVTVTSFSASPSTTAAGGHPNFTTTFNFSYSAASDDVKSTTVKLPPGLTGNPNAATKCTTTQLAADACPASSKIGTVTSVAQPDSPLPLVTLPAVTANGDVYNVAPVGSEPARIGMVIRPPLTAVFGKFSLSGPASVRIPGDYGLNVSFDNLPRTLPAVGGLVPIGVQIKSISLTLNGVVGGKGFMTNPTSCIAATTTATATSYASATPSTRTSTFTPTDCAGVPFNPSIGFLASAPKAGAPESLIIATGVPAGDMPRAQSHIRNTDVFLPTGTLPNFALLTRITPCTDAQLAINSAAPATCPAASQVGVAILRSPLVGTTVGKVYFGSGTAAAPLRQFITAQITPTQTAKFIAVNSLLAGGAIKATLTNLPQTPVTLFALGFPGGPNGLLDAPATCGAHYGVGVFAGWKGGAPIALLAGQNVTNDATGAPCPAAATLRSFAPKLPATAGSAPATVSRRSVLPKRVRTLMNHELRRLAARRARRQR
jgi:hypothetical protein